MEDVTVSVRPLVSGWELAVVGVAAAALAFSGWWLPASVVGPLGAGVVLALGVVAWQRHRRARISTDPRWRDVMPCYLSVQDRDLRILETNELFRRDFGSHLGEHCYRVYKDRESPCPRCPVLRTFEDGENHSGEEQVVTRDGQVADVMVSSSPLRDQHGKTVAVVEMSTNITEVKELQSELDRSREHFRHLFDVVPCYISVQDRDYRIVEKNELFRKDFGDSAGEHCYRIYKGRESICPGCPVEQTFEDGRIHSSEEEVITQDGRKAEMIVHSMPIYDAGGEIAQVMEVSTNITEVKRLQRELGMVGAAVAGMTHRMKNILTGLEGGIFVVSTGFEMSDDEMVEEGWEMVKRNVGKVSRIARDLLYCAKEREPKPKEDVCPADVLQDVYELYRARAESENIELCVDVPAERHTGRFDEDGLHSLVVNLTANAVDACRFDPATDKKHRIVLRCNEDADANTVIEVEDNGAGISEDVSHKVFRGFFSVKGTEGTGIGLLVVQKVTEEHGGTVSFSSREGEGTTFRVVLPALPPPASSDSGDQDEEQGESSAPTSSAPTSGAPTSSAPTSSAPTSSAPGAPRRRAAQNPEGAAGPTDAGG